MVTVDLRKAVPLVAPRIFDPTQKEPNKEKVVKPELDIRSALPPAPPKARSFRPPAPVGAAVQPSAGAIPEPPQIQAVVVVPQIDGVVPAIPKPVEKPKISFDNIAPTSAGTPSEHAVIPNPKIAVDLGNTGAQAGGGGGVLSSTGETEASSSLHTPQLLSGDPQRGRFQAVSVASTSFSPEKLAGGGTRKRPPGPARPGFGPIPNRSSRRRAQGGDCNVFRDSGFRPGSDRGDQRLQPVPAATSRLQRRPDQPPIGIFI